MKKELLFVKGIFEKGRERTENRGDNGCMNGFPKILM